MVSFSQRMEAKCQNQRKIIQIQHLSLISLEQMLADFTYVIVQLYVLNPLSFLKKESVMLSETFSYLGLMLIAF